MSRRKNPESLCNQILVETIQEDILQLLEDVILEDFESEFDDESQEERVSKLSAEISQSLIKQTVEEEMYNIAVDIFDGLVLHHRLKVTGVSKLNQILYKVCDQMVKEIVLEEIGGHILTKHAANTVDRLLDDLILFEVQNTCREVLDHYHMRAGISRFKQIQTSAANVIMDKVVLNSLLQQEDTTIESKNQVLNDFASRCMNDMIFDIVLSQSLALHSCLPKSLSLGNTKSQSRAPVEWFKDKFVTDVAVDVLLDMLVSKLDDKEGAD